MGDLGARDCGGGEGVQSRRMSFGVLFTRIAKFSSQTPVTGSLRLRAALGPLSYLTTLEEHVQSIFAQYHWTRGLSVSAELLVTTVSSSIIYFRRDVRDKKVGCHSTQLSYSYNAAEAADMLFFASRVLAQKR